MTDMLLLLIVVAGVALALAVDPRPYGFRALNLGELLQAKCHFSTFQTQPGSASRRCRRSGSIVSLVLL
jgi:hypothetical protein